MIDKKDKSAREKIRREEEEHGVPMFRSFMDRKIEKLSKGFEETDQLDELKNQPPPGDSAIFCDDGTTPITDDLFTEAEYNAAEAERSGYSNYSYWGSTLRVFLKKKISVFLLIFLVLLLVFTFIQPLLPNQKDPLKIYNTIVGGRETHLSTSSPTRSSGSAPIPSARISGPASGAAPAPHCSSGCAWPSPTISSALS